MTSHLFIAFIAAGILNDYYILNDYCLFKSSSLQGENSNQHDIMKAAKQD
jgi:hypothetical protein